MPPLPQRCSPRLSSNRNRWIARDERNSCIDAEPILLGFVVVRVLLDQNNRARRTMSGVDRNPHSSCCFCRFRGPFLCGYPRTIFLRFLGVIGRKDHCFHSECYIFCNLTLRNCDVAESPNLTVDIDFAPYAFVQFIPGIFNISL